MAELDTSHAASPARHVITLVKGEQRWRFRFEAGHERDMIDALAVCAEDPGHPLDWFDAAILSHQITRRIEAAGSTPSATTATENSSGGAAGAA